MMWVMVKKIDVIKKLIKVCGKIDERDIHPGDEDPQYCYDDAQSTAVSMLTIKQLNKLVKKYEKK